MAYLAVIDTNVIVSSFLTKYPDADDLVFYEIVMEKRDDGAYLVTGNMRHYPAKPCIVTPAQMMRIIEGNPAETKQKQRGNCQIRVQNLRTR